MQNLKIEFLDEDYSAYTLASVIAKFMEEFSGLESLFKSNLRGSEKINIPKLY